MTNFLFSLTENPPTPYPCPVGGRYNFVQHADKENEKYQTRIRGVTQKPRVQVDCRIVVSEMKSCSNDLTKIFVDAEYCETVDYRGRPIGEYGMLSHKQQANVIITLSKHRVEKLDFCTLYGNQECSFLIVMNIKLANLI